LFRADCVKLTLSEGHSSSPKKDEVMTIVSPFLIPALAALPLAACTCNGVGWRWGFWCGWPRWCYPNTPSPRIHHQLPPIEQGVHPAVCPPSPSLCPEGCSHGPQERTGSDACCMLQPGCSIEVTIDTLCSTANPDPNAPCVRGAKSKKASTIALGPA
jgi:hypothetical protein